MKNFLLSPASNAAILGAALVFALLALLQGASGAAQDVTGLALTGGTTNFSALSVNTLSGYAVTATSSISTPALYVGNETQSGAVRFGSATFVTTGTLIAHGFSTTPTTIVLTGRALTNTFTNTIGVLSSNATSFTVAIPGGATVTRLDWMAGK